MSRFVIGMGLGGEPFLYRGFEDLFIFPFQSGEELGAEIGDEPLKGLLIDEAFDEIGGEAFRELFAG